MPQSVPSTVSSTIAHTLLRVGVGGVLVAHGTQKLFGWFGGSGVEGTAQAMHAMGFRPGRRNAVLAGWGEAGAGAALVLGLATPAAGASAATAMGVAAAVHAPNGFFATKGGMEYPALLSLAAACTVIAGSGPVSLDAATRDILDRPWMRAVALGSIPLVAGAQILGRRKALREDAAPAQAAGTPEA